MSSLDPQLFASVDEAVESLLGAEASSKITPVEVARQLDEWADAAVADFAKAAAQIADRADPRYRRIAVDCGDRRGHRPVLRPEAAGRRAVRHLRSDRRPPRAGTQALGQYRDARSAWADFAAGAAKAYVDDITFGFDSQLRGHWQDRLPAIDRDIAMIAAREAPGDRRTVTPEVVARAIAAVLEPRPRPMRHARAHARPPRFRPGQALSITARAPADTISVRLQYRHLNQAETYRIADMERNGDSWRATVPAEYTRSPFPLQYYFEVRSGAGVALWPGFGSDFTGTPYLVSQPSS